MWFMTPKPRAAFGQGFADLLAKARAGDNEALGQLLEGYRALLLAEAHEQSQENLRGKAGASDLVQAAFTKAVEAFNHFRGQSEGELIGWLKVILANTSRNFEKRYGQACRRVGKESPLEDGAGCLPDDAPSPSAEAVRNEETQRLLRAEAALPAELRAVLVMAHERELRWGDIGEKLGVTERTARRWYKEAVERLQQALAAPPRAPGDDRHRQEERRGQDDAQRLDGP
jgi:RNA polymerase sigma-70 factor (ECF subfamily)